MDAREVLARKILWDDNPGVDPYSDDPWAGDQALHDAYLATADEYIAALDQAGYTIVRKPTGTEPTVEVPRRLLYRAFCALELQPIRGTWHRDDELARDWARKDLRRVLQLVYRCQTCGEWLAEEDLEGGGHIATVADQDGNLEPVLCGPVHRTL